MGSIAQEEHPPKPQSHYKDWPNEAGFNATEIHGETKTPVKLEIKGYFPDYVAGSLFRTGPGAYKVARTNSSASNGKVVSNGTSGDDKAFFAVSHWFDGFTTTHRFDLVADNSSYPSNNDGKNDTAGRCTSVLYSSRQQVDRQVEKARQTGKLDNISFGQKRDPCESLYQKFKTAFTPALGTDPHASNVGVTLREPLPAELASLKLGEKDKAGRKLMTLGTDHQLSKVFDAETLEPLGVVEQKQIHLSLTGPLSAAHPCRDPVTGDLFNYNLAFGKNETYRIWRASSSGETEILATIAGNGVRGAYIHSMFLTDNFVILCVWPAYFQSRGAKILWERNLLDAFKFDPNGSVTWFVVDRRHGRGVVKKFTSSAFFCFHTVNAWEERREDGVSVDLICELCETSNTDIIHHFYYTNMISNSPSAPASKEKLLKSTTFNLTRHRLADVPLPSSQSAVSSRRTSNSTTSSSLQTKPTEKILAIPTAGDLPNINPHYALKPHRYVYTLVDRGLSSFIDGLGKTDTATGETVFWEKAHHTPGEPIFVPRPGGVEEDDGVVLAVVLDGDKGTSYLLCLDAKTFEEVGRAETGVAVGFGFHGRHVPAAV